MSDPDSRTGTELDLLRSLQAGLGDMIVAFDETGTMVYANEASTSLVGLRPDELVARSVFDFLHPDDLERAMMALDLNNEFGSAPGTTMFRVRHADGTWLQVDMTGGQATAEDGRVLYTSSSRRADDRFSITETMLRLLRGSSMADALRPVLDVFAWRQNGSQIGVSWLDSDGRRAALSTGIDLGLVGVDAGDDEHPGGSTDEGPTPWDDVRRTGEAFMALDLDLVGQGLARRARDLGFCSCWIEPIESGDERGLLTVWTRPGGRPPINHAHAMATVKPIAALILRWFEQQRQLDFAAFHDALTGVANRKRFFDALEACTTGGAVLYCDLDRFKPINDELGHAAGDELLRGVAARLASSVRDGDLVARLGGDEFAVLCPGASAREADALVDTIELALGEPFTVAGTEVTIGVSVGIGLADGRIGDLTLEAADEALYRVKRQRAGRRADDR